MWKITKLETISSLNGLQNVVYKIWWEYSLTENNITESINGIVELSSPNPESFIIYANLTEAIVLDWVFTKVTKDFVEYFVHKAIQDKTQPTTVILTNPWE